MSRNRMFAAALVVGLITGFGFAQAPPKTDDQGSAKAESKPVAKDKDALTAEESERLQNLSGGKMRQRTWSEFVADWMTAKPFDKKLVVRVDERYAYPHIVASIKMEIVREDEQYIWLRGISPEDPNSPLYKMWARREADEALALDWEEIANTPGAINYLDYEAVVVPPPFLDALEFEPVTANLSKSGRWQMGFAVADMNEDGHPDLVFPPRRKDYPVVPTILLGDGAGGFENWQDAKWPREMAWDYGGVVAADFNNDGHQDLAFAIHFKAQFVLYGNGEGLFPTGERLKSPDPRLTSRAVVAADFDDDGRTDLGFVAEVDFDLQSNKKIEKANSVWVMFNRDDGWILDAEGLPANVIADVIRGADLDGDGRPELVVSTNTLGVRFLAFSYRGADGWQPAEHRGVLSAAYHYDVEPFDDKLFTTFLQFRKYQGATQARNGIIRYQVRFGGDDDDLVIGQPVVWDKERTNVFFRLAVGDLDGNGRADFVAARNGGGLEAYLQTVDGQFYRERGSELEGVGRAFDIRLLDLDGDGRDDIVAGCVTQGEKPGGVYVWLTRPAE